VPGAQGSSFCRVLTGKARRSRPLQNATFLFYNLRAREVRVASINTVTVQFTVRFVNPGIVNFHDFTVLVDLQSSCPKSFATLPFKLEIVDKTDNIIRQAGHLYRYMSIDICRLSTPQTKPSAYRKYTPNPNANNSACQASQPSTPHLAPPKPPSATGPSRNP
jgi:hypothetical protein